MRLNALLLSRDEDAMSRLTSALRQLGIQPELCAAASDAVESLATSRYSAVLLDFELPGARELTRLVRTSPARKRPVIFVMIGALNHIAGAFQAGADFVLYKPLAWDQLMRSLRAGQAFMQSERRHSPRHALETLAYMQFGVAAVPALILDVNETGISIQSPEPLPGVAEVPLRFVLPGTAEMIEATGDLVWADREGRAGMLFASMNSRCRRSLLQWLRKRSTSKRSLSEAAREARSRRQSASAH
jgi:CheY-like chemotaxis protein